MERRVQIRMIAFFVAIVGFCCVASASTETVRLFDFRLPAICVFKLITGLDCPGCGMTRALVLAFHGRFYESYLMHIWGIPLAVFFLTQIALRLARLSAGFQPSLSTPTIWKRWGTHFVFLSLLVPWAVKTIAILIVQW